MKLTVFHGVFLVLVVWADHSHGRRAPDSECILTEFSQQPYKENMSAETVLNNGLWRQDYSILVLQWPRTFCFYNRKSCRKGVYNIYNHFTVHGLWPQQYHVRCINCLGAQLTNFVSGDVCFVFPFKIHACICHFHSFVIFVIFIHSLFCISIPFKIHACITLFFYIINMLWSLFVRDRITIQS